MLNWAKKYIESTMQYKFDNKIAIGIGQVNQA